MQVERQSSSTSFIDSLRRLKENSMTKAGRKVAALVLGTTLATSALLGVARADRRDFEFVNTHSSASIVGAWIRHAGNNVWSPISLYTPVGPRASSRIVVAGGGGCMNDVKILFDDGAVQYFNNVNLCEVARLIAT
jgi:hypothetical protein